MKKTNNTVVSLHLIVLVILVTDHSCSEHSTVEHSDVSSLFSMFLETNKYRKPHKT